MSTLELQNYHAKLVNWISESQAGLKGKEWKEGGQFEEKMLSRREGLARIIAGRKVVEGLKEVTPKFTPISELSYRQDSPNAIRPLYPTPLPRKIVLPSETTETCPSPSLSPVPNPSPPLKRKIWEVLGVDSQEEALILLQEARQLREERSMKALKSGPSSSPGPRRSARLLKKTLDKGTPAASEETTDDSEPDPLLAIDEEN